MRIVNPRPLISVVVPVFNGTQDLPGCLSSIATATGALAASERRSIEVIVCDNWSDDGSHQFALDFELPVSYRVMRPASHEPNRTRNWSAGLAAARGKWMLMLHADDLMAPHGLIVLLRAITRPEAAGATIISGRHRTFTDPRLPGRLQPRWAAASLVPGTLLTRTVLTLHCPFMPFVLMRRSAYEAVGGLDERWELVQDWDLWMRLSNAGDVFFVPQEIAWWRVHPTSPKYREINAREHVALSRRAPQRTRRSSPSWRVRPREVALAHAAIQLQGVEADSNTWLGGDALPTISTAREVLAHMHRTVSFRLFALRAVGVVRRILPLRRGAARQH
jgi:glycosyltransferase involved in cell wall biosynthesis